MIKISKVDIKEYSKKFNLKTNLSSEKHSTRKGFYLKIYGGDIYGIGESAPIPGVSSESLESVGYALQGFKLAVQDLNYNVNIEELLLLSRVHGHGLPSVIFCLESAIYDLFSKLTESPIASLLNPSYLPQININCIDSKFSTIEKKIANIIKIKINSSNPDVVKNKIEEVLKTCKSSVKIRLDFNGILNFFEAKKIFHVIRNYNIDYVEQPFAPKNLKDVTRLREITEIKIALDESVDDFFSIKNVVEKKIVDTIIIKPTLIGGFNDIKKINEYCKKNNVRIILTSSFETEIAQNYIIHLISALEIKEYCGVANIELFSKSQNRRDDDKITLPKSLS